MVWWKTQPTNRRGADWSDSRLVSEISTGPASEHFLCCRYCLGAQGYRHSMEYPMFTSDSLEVNKPIKLLDGIQFHGRTLCVEPARGEIIYGSNLYRSRLEYRTDNQFSLRRQPDAEGRMGAVTRAGIGTAEPPRAGQEVAGEQSGTRQDNA